MQRFMTAITISLLLLSALADADDVPGDQAGSELAEQSGRPKREEATVLFPTTFWIFGREFSAPGGEAIRT